MPRIIALGMFQTFFMLSEGGALLHNIAGLNDGMAKTQAAHALGIKQNSWRHDFQDLQCFVFSAHANFQFIAAFDSSLPCAHLDSFRLKSLQDILNGAYDMPQTQTGQHGHNAKENNSQQSDRAGSKGSHGDGDRQQHRFSKEDSDTDSSKGPRTRKGRKQSTQNKKPQEPRIGKCTFKLVNDFEVYANWKKECDKAFDVGNISTFPSQR